MLEKNLFFGFQRTSFIHSLARVPFKLFMVIKLNQFFVVDGMKQNYVKNFANFCRFRSTKDEKKKKK